MKNINVIAMAGSGKRFVNKGFKIIKPLILFRKKPIIFYSVKSLPFSKKKIFICRKIHFKNFELNKVFKKYFKNFKFIQLIKENSGQAVTCYQAVNHIPSDYSVTFGSCDYDYKFNKRKFRNLIKKFDLIVFVTRPDKDMLRNPNQYGWVKKAKENHIEKISCKNKVSSKPKNDFVIIGSFSFKDKKIFIKSFKLTIRKKQKINNEYYMDVVAKNALLLGYKVGYVNVYNYKNFGTPHALKSYK